MFGFLFAEMMLAKSNNEKRRYCRTYLLEMVLWGSQSVAAPTQRKLGN